MVAPRAATGENQEPVGAIHSPQRQAPRDKLGVGGLEPPTSALSELRSNQLSYTPFHLLVRTFYRSGFCRREEEVIGVLPTLQPWIPPFSPKCRSSVEGDKIL